MDAGRVSAGISGAVVRGLDALDGIVHAHVPGKGRAGAGLAGVARGAGPLLADVGALPRADVERRGTGPFDGRQRHRGEPLPRPAGRDVHDPCLSPWFENLGKRIVKSPKVFLRDSGILHFLLGLEDRHDLPLHPRYGASWEGFALEQTLLAHGERDAFFYATQRGAELDLLLLRHGRRWGFEFKCTDAPRTTKSMHVVTKDLGLEHLWVLYPGDQEYPLADAMTALPLKNIHTLQLRSAP